MLANSGTPLLVAGILHLLVGNTLIGIAEGFWFAHRVKCSRKISVLLFILANYASAWLGVLYVFSPTSREFWGGVTVENLRSMMVLQIGVAFLLTLAAELPFALFASRWGAHTAISFRRVVWNHALVQLISYVIMFPGYACVSDTSVVWANVTTPDTLLPAGLRVFYIGEDGRRLFEHNSTSGQTSEIGQLGSESSRHTLLMEENGGSWNVVVIRRIGLNDQSTVTIVEAGIPVDKCPLLQSGVPVQWPQHAWNPAVSLSKWPHAWDYFGDSWGFGLSARRIDESVADRRLALNFELSATWLGRDRGHPATKPDGAVPVREEPDLCL